MAFPQQTCGCVQMMEEVINCVVCIVEHNKRLLLNYLNFTLKPQEIHECQNPNFPVP